MSAMPLTAKQIESGERIAKLDSDVEHLKVTRFEAKRECHSMKTSLSWRLTWPLRVLRDSSTALLDQLKRRGNLSLTAQMQIPATAQQAIVVRRKIKQSATQYRPRTEKLLTRFTKEHKILEIGPSYNPLVTRSDGWNCYSLDHGTAEELRARYGNDPAVDYGKRIQSVDFVWRSGPIDSAIPPEQLGTFDGVVASHVVEHTPDLVAFFESVGNILQPNGYLSLAVPDKRFCFDYFQPVSLTGDVLAAYHEKRTRHTKKTAYQGAAYRMQLNGNSSGTQEPVKSHTICDPDLKLASRMFQQQDPSPSSPYVDWHNWYFTPSSFRLICLELRILGLIAFQEVEFFDVSGNEFIVCLQRSTKPVEGTGEAERLRLLKKMVLELGDQAMFMLEGMSPAEIANLRRL